MLIYAQKVKHANICTKSEKCQYMHKKWKMLIYAQKVKNANICTKHEKC